MLSKHWMGASELQTPLVELIRYTSSGLGKDVLAALERARDREDPGSRAHATFALMLENVSRARARSAPICQDTGTLIFYVDHGPEVPPSAWRRPSTKRCRVREVYKLEELGVPEAMWHIEVKDFPTVVTMDSHGGSLHAEMEAASAVEARALMEKNPHLGK